MKKTLICILAMLLVFSSGAYALAKDAVAKDQPRIEPAIAPEINVSPGIAVPPEKPASDSGTISEDLARVTQNVKTTLGLDDSFTEFYGNQTESGQGIIWSLNWNNDEEKITVEAGADGTIYSYNNYSNEDRYYSYNNDFAPIFPKNEREQAQKIAEEFLHRVLGENESFQAQEEKNMPLQPRAQYDFYFYGYIALNDVPSPFYANISVNATHMRVTNFWRQNPASEYIGEIPSSTPQISATTAAQKLAAPQKFTLAYYLPDNSKNEARLQYRPVNDNTYYVDAHSGELLDMNKLYADAEKSIMDRGLSGGEGNAYGFTAADEAASAMSESQLSGAEQAGIEKMADLLSREELDAKLRAISELGLDESYILSGVNYQQEQQYKSPGGSDRSVSSGGYKAYLNYYREAKPIELGLSEQAYQRLKGDGRGLYLYKYAQVNATTGEFISISTSRPYVEAALITEKERDSAAGSAAFLKKYFSDYYTQSAVQKQSDAGTDNHVYSYAQQVNGYSFAGNFLNVSANPYTGIIENFYMNWDESVTFAASTGIISEAKAKNAYLNTLECKLLYRGLPQAVDPAQSDVQPLTRYYGGMLYRMALVYSYEQPAGGAVYAIDALSGDPLSYSQYERQQIVYDDIAGNAAQTQIEELARYGIGYEGGKFKPNDQLTELDMLVFLLSADGYIFTGLDSNTKEPDQDEIDSIYRNARSRGIIGSIKPQPTRQISRGELVQTIVAMSGYGKTAALPGIYICNFADAKEISAELYGYVAIAMGLGMVEGGETREFKAAETVTRAEAAMIFYNFMARKY